MGDLLDVHPALRRDDEGDAAGLAVDQQRKIEFALDVGPVFEIEAVHLLTGRPGLDRHQRIAEHLADEGLDLRDRAGEAHAALVAGRRLLELPLAAATRMDLALDDPERAAEFLRGRLGLGDVEHRNAA